MLSKDIELIEAHLIVNVFNGGYFLSQTLESLVHQDYEHIYIHCFDNQSTDSTSEIIDSYKRKFNNIKSYCTPNHIPLVEARNYALSTVRNIVKSPFYFAFCDADDLWEPAWISTLMKFSNYDYDLLICNGHTLEDEIKTPYSSCLSLARLSPFSCPVSIQSCLFSSNIIQEDSVFFIEKFQIAYDTEFWLRRGSGLKYLHVSDYLFMYRIHANSMAHSNFLPILRERWGMLKLHKLSLVRFLFGFLGQLKNMIFSFK
jgi:glycosyltransferase involved in cell wall biosynthesis